MAYGTEVAQVYGNQQSGPQERKSQSVLSSFEARIQEFGTLAERLNQIITRLHGPRPQGVGDAKPSPAAQGFSHELSRVNEQIAELSKIISNRIDEIEQFI